jgi:hypothetical protein
MFVAYGVSERGTMHAKERLEHLLELAGKGHAEAPQLARELCELLLDWPQAYPPSMRVPFESLLEKTVRLLDDDQRKNLMVSVGSGGDLPLSILNEFFFIAPERLRSRILSRNAKIEASNDEPLPNFDAAAFVTAARQKKGEAYARAFASLFGISKAAADAVLGDISGEALAIACKGAELPRAVFSSIALLTGPSDPASQKTRLAAFEQVSVDAARNMVRFWRQRFDIPPVTAAADQAA